MTTTNTLATTQKLTKAGFPGKQAEAQAEAHEDTAQAARNGLASDSDFALLIARLDARDKARDTRDEARDTRDEARDTRLEARDKTRDAEFKAHMAKTDDRFNRALISVGLFIVAIAGLAITLTKTI